MLDESILPTALIEYDQWICWREQERDGKPTARPVSQRLEGRIRRRSGQAGRGAAVIVQQTLSGCAFCNAFPGSEVGEACTWGKDEVVTYPICVDCAIQERPDPDGLDRHACDGCGLIVDSLPALTSFRVEVGHLEGTVRFCARCCPGGSATYWTRDLEEHRVSDAQSG